MLHRVSDAAAGSDFAAVEQALLARWPESRIGPGLGRMNHLLNMLGEPQRSIASIHVTGTNGKTSTSRMIEALLRSFGLRTGLFTSPHLHHITERVQLNGEPVRTDRFIAAYQELLPYIDMVDERSVAEGGPRMTFFESMTGLAYAIFADAPVDVMVIEVGIGGTHDATNVIEPDVAVITPIDFDHMHILGNTLTEIAENKAGIIDAGSIPVVSAQAPEAAAAIMKHCAALEALPLREGIEFELLDRRPAVGGQLLTVRGVFGEYDELFLPLYGQHQAQNAAVAVAAVESFLGGGIDGERARLDIDVVREGFAQMKSPGRLEVVSREPLAIVDAAHNPAGAATIKAALAESFALDHVVAVVSVLGDKDVNGLLEHLVGVADQIIVTQNESQRAMPAADLAEIASKFFPEDAVQVQPDFNLAVADACAKVIELRAAGKPAAVLATGSVVTAAQARALLARKVTA